MTKIDVMFIDAYDVIDHVIPYPVYVSHHSSTSVDIFENDKCMESRDQLRFTPFPILKHGLKF